MDFIDPYWLLLWCLHCRLWRRVVGIRTDELVCQECGEPLGFMRDPHDTPRRAKKAMKEPLA